MTRPPGRIGRSRALKWTAAAVTGVTMYILVPLLLGASGCQSAHDSPLFRAVPAWRALFIVGWESAGREGKPRLKARNAQ